MTITNPDETARDESSVATPNETADVPYRIVDDVHVRAERYYDPTFFALECDKLWTSAWQAACRLEDLPAAGDFIEYQIAGRSILVVRQADGTIKAFENACRHRATALGSGCGRFAGGKIVCPFHGWRFDLDGTCSWVYGERGFRPDTMTADVLRLVECQVATRWGIVWLTMDDGAPPFEVVMASVLPVLDSIGLDTARTNWWRAVRIKANWKIALEAFMESYHVLQTHPELAGQAIGDDYDADTSRYELNEEWGHGWLESEGSAIRGMALGEFLVLNNRVLADGVGRPGWITDAQLAMQEELWGRVPDTLTDDEFLLEFYTRVYADAAAAGVQLPERPALGLAYVFPNIALINNLGNSMIYRFRPDGLDAEACVWEIWSVGPAPADAPLDRPVLELLRDQSELPSVYVQDASNMELQQRGLHADGFVASVYSPRYEPLIPNMHRVLDRFLAR